MVADGIKAVVLYYHVLYAFISRPGQNHWLLYKQCHNWSQVILFLFLRRRKSQTVRYNAKSHELDYDTLVWLTDTAPNRY